MLRFVGCLVALLVAGAAHAVPLPPLKPGTTVAVPLPPKKPAATVASKPEVVAAQKPTLKGTRANVVRVFEVAKAHDLSRVQDDEQLAKFVSAKLLVPVVATEHLTLHQVANSVARPELKAFLEGFAPQYHAACGEPMVVTSLVRTLDEQPWNASQFSVHPTGIAADFRIPGAPCRAWLEKTLLALEAKGTIDATRERHPPHYHVVVLPATHRLARAKR